MLTATEVAPGLNSNLGHIPQIVQDLRGKNRMAAGEDSHPSTAATWP